MNIYCLFIWIFSKLKIQGRGLRNFIFSLGYFENSQFNGRDFRMNIFLKECSAQTMHIDIILISLNAAFDEYER